MRTYHLKFEAANGDARYEPAFKAEIVVSPDEHGRYSYINGYIVTRDQAESAVRSFERSHSLPGLGVWDCGLEDGGMS